MDRSRLLVESLIHAAEAHHVRGADDVASLIARVAATVARRRNTGAYAIESLETLLLSMSRRLSHSSEGFVNTQVGTGRLRPTVLHIMTGAFAAGGHTRLVTRWIEFHEAARSSLVITEPANPEPPGQLAEAVSAAGGRILRLGGTIADRALALRSLAHDADTLVLSIHEDDIVPSLALAAAAWRPPTVVVNHADHVFWVGASVADVVASLRPSGQELATRRRGIMANRSMQMPIPIRSFPRRASRERARVAIGLHGDHRLLLTVGQAYKFAPVNGRHLIEALGPILEAPDVRLVAIGPTENDEPWVAARNRYGDRVQAIGMRPDIDPFMDAADVYLDSYPIPSITAALDAGALGLPVVSLSPDGEWWPDVAVEDDPALVDHVLIDVARYRERVGELVRSASTRAAAGRSIQLRIDEVHGSQAWLRSLDRVLDAARDAASMRSTSVWRPAGKPGLQDVLLAEFIAAHDKRPDLRFTPEEGFHGRRTQMAAVNQKLTRIDSLILESASPAEAAYRDAIRTARSLSPARLRLRTGRWSRS